ncbi:MAG: M28 family peptidase, partial [Myxococcales bacterium]|nr:M28 family peptidase [Myxococcales bacterium]
PLTCGTGSAAAVAGCVDKAKIADDLAFIAAPRPAGSDHWKAVQDRCFDRLTALGYTVERQDWGGGVNVIGRRAGTTDAGTAVVLSAHYDHIALLDAQGRSCPGADDNASGVAGLLEAARVLATRDTARTLIVACWDGEENGLVGSRAWTTLAAADDASIALSVVFEMIGFRATDPDTQELPTGFDTLFADAAAAVAANGNRGDFIAAIGNGKASEAIDRVAVYGEQTGAKALSIAVPDTIVKASAIGQLRRSDHATFWDRGYPSFMLTDTANFRNPNYHCAGGLDTVDTLDLDFAAGVVANAVGVVGETLDGAL